MSRHTQAAVIPLEDYDLRIQVTVPYGGFREVAMRLDKASSSPSRNSVGLLSQVRLPATEHPWIWFGTHRPVGPRTITYARID